MPEVKNCLTCKWCSEWIWKSTCGSGAGEQASCLWGYPAIPTCIDIFDLPPRCVVEKHMINGQLVIGMVNRHRAFIRIANCPAHQPKADEE